jgi:phosphoribosylaminoimidazolecarboxamide formyltransferase/IMP cyclohydrolase
MTNLNFKNALISVSDKTGLIDFVKPLAESGMRIVSSGGTAKHLMENGIEVVQVNEQTGFPEVMDGRVKTLHPNIHMCLLARDHVAEDLSLLKQHDLEPFDLVIGNLYPFEQASKGDLEDQQLAEYIDIGGPSLLRAAAKSYQRITVICEPGDYQWIGEKNELTLDDRKVLAAKVFSHVSSYDGMIANQLANNLDMACLGGDTVSHLRYGENPDQQAVWKKRKGAKGGLHEAEILQGKALSYNNISDLDAAITALRDFPGQAAVAVKHNNPCGIGIGESGAGVIERALKADPVSVFGGIVSTNCKVDEVMAEKLTGLFLECVVAPEYESAALEVLAKKKTLRVLKWPGLMEENDNYLVKSVSGGYLVQSLDEVRLWADEWSIKGQEPQGDIRSACELAWKSCAHLKSNAISLACSTHTVGLGMGQVNRVDAVEQAIQRWHKHHADQSADQLVLASDAFFPFPDSIELIAKAGIKWVVQPGGSIKDADVFSAAEKRGVNIVVTGQRHFKH